MVEAEGNGAVAAPGGEGVKIEKPSALRLDLDAFLPDPTTTVVVKGTEYGVMSLLDVSSEEALEALKLDDGIRALPLSEQIERTRRQIAILVPTMPPEVLAKLTTSQLIRIAAHATGAAMGPKNPPTAAVEVASASASPSPEPVASTVGSPV